MATFPVREQLPYQEQLRRNITECLADLRRARFDGNIDAIETLEGRFDWLIDRLPRPKEKC